MSTSQQFDFASLSTIELENFLKAALAEYSARNIGKASPMEYARLAKFLYDADEQARIQKASEEKRRVQLARLWSLKKRHAQALDELLTGNLHVTVWSKDGEKRVYLSLNDFYKGTNLAVLYVTGNPSDAPGKFLVYQKYDIETNARLKEIMQALGRDFIETKFRVSEAIAYDEQ